MFTSMSQPRFSEREDPRALVDAEMEKLISEYEHELTQKVIIDIRFRFFFHAFLVMSNDFFDLICLLDDH